METARRSIEITNQRGLHARASAKFVAAVTLLDGCEVEVIKDGDGRPRAARSSG